MSTTHTPGPWDNASNYPGLQSVRIFAGTRYIATVGNTDDTKDQTEANARLIAAAPDLLEALVKLLPVIDDAESDAVAKSIKAQEDGKEPFRLKWLDIAGRFKAQADDVREAIAKAEGKEPA